MRPVTWAILAACVWGAAPLLEKIALSKMNFVSGVFLRSGGVMIGMMFLAFIQPAVIKSITVYDIKSIICVLSGGILASIIGQLFFYQALQNGDASQVVPIAAAYPLITCILSIFLLHEGITAAKVMGIVCIMAGVYFLK